MENEGFNGINIIPLVDIMLVLITIVLITSNFMVRGLLPVNLPKSESAAADTIKEVVLLEMTADGTLYFKEQPLGFSEIGDYFAPYDKELPVIISADKDLVLQPFIRVVDALKQAGFTKINVQTESP